MKLGDFFLSLKCNNFDKSIDLNQFVKMYIFKCT